MRSMGEVERLITAFGVRGKRDQVSWKLDVLLDLGALDHPRVADFLVTVLTDVTEPTEVRTDALRRLRDSPLTPDQRVAAAAAGVRVLAARSGTELRLHAALALGDFAGTHGVVAALGALALDPDEPLELRYNAFTSLQRAGPTSECLALLQALRADETLGPSARGVLAAWRARTPRR